MIQFLECSSPIRNLILYSKGAHCFLEGAVRHPTSTNVQCSVWWEIRGGKVYKALKHCAKVDKQEQSEFRTSCIIYIVTASLKFT